jgi:hypothetical protein
MTLAMVADFAPLETALPSAVNDTGVGGVVHSLIAQSKSDSHRPQRRRDERIPYPNLLEAVPVATDGAVLTEESMTVVGKHLSERGLDFYCQEPIPYRRMIIRLEGPDDQHVWMLIDLTWCRFNRLGWYDNGGRFLQVVDGPPGN